MTSSLFDQTGPHNEPSQLVAYSQNKLDRQSEHRPDDCLEVALKTDGAHAFAISGGRLVMKHDRQVLDALYAPYELAPLQPDAENAVLLGYEQNGEPRLAVPVNVDIESLPELYKAVDFRSIYMQELLEPSVLGQMAQGGSLVAWNLANLFCGKCGAPTTNTAGGYRRSCSACNHMIFPRTDPVVIMLAIDTENDRCLLGRSPHFPEGMYSCLAGFVEPGETLENAVRRETHEEAGITIGRVRYYASQPWPMPHTLMIGCYAEATSLDICRDTEELEDCRWFTREETKAMLPRGPGDDASSPPPGAIAYRLMEDWVNWRDYKD